MTEKSSFFNSVQGDRVYDAKDFADYFASVLTNGVHPNPSSNLQVQSNNDYTITIQKGKAFVNGYFYENTTDKTITISPADGVLKRIDVIVVRLDLGKRTIETTVKEGAFSAEPVAPTLQRDEVIHELAIAEVTVQAAAPVIRQQDILDTRQDTERCGYVNSLIQADTSDIYQNYKDWFNTSTTQFEQDWEAWFKGIQMDAANHTHPQYEEELTNKQNIVTYGATFPTTPDIGDLHIKDVSADEKEMYRFTKGETKNDWEKISGKSDVFKNHGLGTKNVRLSAGYDLNSLYGKGTGFFCGNELVNAPTSDWYYIVHQEYDDGQGNVDTRCSQIAYRQTSSGQYEIYYRCWNLGQWQAWMKISSGIDTHSAFRVSSTNTTINTDNAYHAYPYNSTGSSFDYDNLGEFDTVNHCFVPKEDGIYTFTAAIGGVGMTQGSDFRLVMHILDENDERVRDDNLIRTREYFYDDYDYSGTTTMKVKKGEEVVVRYLLNSGGTGKVSNKSYDTFFTGAKIN